ncbi:coenzyme A pyrophosphatase [Halobacteriales archaeon QS_5_70_15]|nr:MAG: coenzyme A pyrophosphatase [Halobacteriales archaeon QS_5_70_15]
MDLSRLSEHAPTEVTDEEREAAVLAPVVTREARPHLMFVKRSADLSSHAGQMAFPGGGREPTDADLRETALREAREEAEVDPGETEVVGRLDDIRTTSRYSVRPYVARVPDREYAPDGVEVTEVAVLAVEDLIDRSNYDSERRDHPYYGDIRLHYFRVDGYVVWGATARILAQLLELTTDWTVPEEPDRHVEPDAEFRV